MSDNPVTAAQDDGRPVPRGPASSDYGVWPDEGADSSTVDVAAPPAEVGAGHLTDVLVGNRSGTRRFRSSRRDRADLGDDVPAVR